MNEYTNIERANFDNLSLYANLNTGSVANMPYGILNLMLIVNLELSSWMTHLLERVFEEIPLFTVCCGYDFLEASSV